MPEPDRSYGRFALLLTSLLLLTAALVLEPSSRDLAEAVDREPITTGDVNGDGSLDISDAVYVLIHLFQGGPPPVEIDIGGATPALPATGQDRCFDCSGNAIDCSSVQYPGQDALYGIGCELAGRFVDNGDGTVTDLCTGLEWEKSAADLDGNASPDTGRWCQGLRYAEGLTLAGHSDWRVPNAQELHSLVAYGKSSGWLPEVFEGPSGPYWTSTTDLDDILRAWSVSFSGSPTMAARIKASEHSYTRAVRTQ